MKNKPILVSIFIAGLSVGFVIENYWIFPFLYYRLHNWQDLSGSLIGALFGAVTAVVLFFATNWHKNLEEQRNHVRFLLSSISAALSNLNEIDTTLHLFADQRIPKILKHIERDIAAGNPSIGHAFVPLQYVSEISDELLKTYSGSDYITAKTVFLVNRSKDCRKIIDDLTRQFEQTLTLNAQIVLHKVNTNHQIANEAFKENILLFKETLENQIFKNNIPKYAKELILAQVAVSQLQEWGPRKWRRFFTKHARPESIIQDIDAYFNDAVNARVDLLQPFFISNLKADSE